MTTTTDPGHRSPQTDYLRASRYAHLPLQARVRLQAMRSLVEIIECECTAVPLTQHTWWDTRPMLSSHEHSPEVIDLNTEIIDLACTLQLAARHPSPELAHLVCVLFTPL